MSPENVVEPLLMTSRFPPIKACPEPDKVLIAAPTDVCEISKMPLSMTLEDMAIEPVPVSARVVPVLMVVVPV